MYIRGGLVEYTRRLGARAWAPQKGSYSPSILKILLTHINIYIYNEYKKCYER